MTRPMHATSWAGQGAYSNYSSLRTGPLAPALPRSLLSAIGRLHSWNFTQRRLRRAGCFIDRSATKPQTFYAAQFWSARMVAASKRPLGQVSALWDYLEGGALVMSANEVLASDITVSPLPLLYPRLVKRDNERKSSSICRTPFAKSMILL